MSRLSHKLSVTSVHEDLPFGSPSTSLLAKTLHEPSILEAVPDNSETSDTACQQDGLGKTRARSAAASSSTYSTFSSAGDDLPDETVEDTVRNLPISSDMDEVLRIANLIAQKRGISADILVPKILKLCDENASVTTTEQDTHEAWYSTSVPVQSRPHAKTVPLFSLPNGRDAGVLARLSRRFSFDFGDDSGFGSLQSEMRAGAPDMPEPLRRSQSAADHLVFTSTKFTKGGDTSPLLSQSPSLLASSMIPAPAQKSPLARPRREGSSSSTTIDLVLRHFGSSASSRAQSRASSRLDIPSCGTEHGTGPGPQSTSNSAIASTTRAGGIRLVQGMQLLRSNSLAIAAARTASNVSGGSSGNDG